MKKKEQEQAQEEIREQEQAPSEDGAEEKVRSETDAEKVARPEAGVDENTQPASEVGGEEDGEDEQESGQVFRKKALDRIASPEELNEYIRVTTPSMWLVMLAVIILLVGAVVFAVFGTIESNVTVAAVVKDKQCTCYIPSDRVSGISVGDTVTIGQKTYSVKSMSPRPSSIQDDFPEYALYVSGMKVGDWAYEAEADVDLEDGVYEAHIVDERVKPMSFVTKGASTDEE